MSEPFDIQSAEPQAAREMQRRIGNHLSYAEAVYRLLDLAISHDDEREIAVGSVDYVALLLMGRMANDVRAIGTLAQLGYEVQACTLAASILEVAFTFVDIATDDKRAVAWSNHTNSRHSLISARAAIEKFVRRMPWSEAQKQTAECRQKAVYEVLCQFKHANPRSMSPRAIDDGYFDNRLGPDTTHFGVLTASAAILHAGWCVGLALHQWADARSLPAAARIRFDQELAALVRHYEVVDDQTRGLKGCFDASIKSATHQQD